MDTYLVLLLSPFLLVVAIYCWQSLPDLTYDFRGWKSLKLLPAALWLFFVVVYLIYGPTWFCGTCYRSGMIFLGLSLGSALVVSASLFSSLLAPPLKIPQTEALPVSLGVVIILLVLMRVAVERF